MSRNTFLTVTSAIAAVLILTVVVVRAERGKAAYHPETYVSGEGPVVVSAQIDKLAFQLNRVDDKYKMVRFSVENKSDTSLKLSSVKDEFAAIVRRGDEEIRLLASLRPLQSDPEFWQKLDLDTRQSLAYPSKIEPRNEVELFVLFPHDQFDRLPDRFVWKIDDLELEITIDSLRRLREAEIRDSGSGDERLPEAPLTED